MLPAWAALTALLLGGCADELGGGARKAEGSLPSATASSSAATPADTPADTPAGAPSATLPSTLPSQPGEAPATGPTRRVEASGFSFEVPKGWVELDAGELFEGAAGNDEIEKLADRLGISSDQLLATVGNADLFLFSNEGAHAGRVDNLNVIQVPAGQLNASQIELGLLAVGAEDLDVQHVSTAAGDAVRARYDITFAGQKVLASAVSRS